MCSNFYYFVFLLRIADVREVTVYSQVPLAVAMTMAHREKKPVLVGPPGVPVVNILPLLSSCFIVVNEKNERESKICSLSHSLFPVGFVQWNGSFCDPV